MYRKILKRIGIFIVFIMLIRGIYLICNWNYRHQEFYKEGNTLEEISLDDLSVGYYVSFYIDDYVKREISSPTGNEYSGVSKIYTEENIEYEIYTILLERKTSEHEDLYIWIMVKDQETKQKLKNLGQGKVYFQGELISTPFELREFDEDWYRGTEEGICPNYDNHILDMTIKQTELPDDGNDLYVGIALVIIALISYRMIGGIKACVPDVAIYSKQFDEYCFEYGVPSYNIENELLFEKDNLKKLQAEQIENKKVCNVMIVVFIVGLLIYFWVPVFVVKIFAFVPMYMGIGGVWSRFINSSHKLAVYIAYKRGKRSIYLEIEECKKNIEVLERIMDNENYYKKCNQ